MERAVGFRDSSVDPVVRTAARIQNFTHELGKGATMPPKKNAIDIVEMAANASRDYIDTSDRMLTLVERLSDAHVKLLQMRRQRDELLLSAVTAWHSLGRDERQRLNALLRVVNHPAAEKLLTSIQRPREENAPTEPPTGSPVSDGRLDDETRQNPLGD